MKSENLSNIESKMYDFVLGRPLNSVGFKLIELELVQNSYLENLHLTFCDNLDDLENFPYSTILIGSNGTGKSNILRTIIDIYRELYKLKTEGKRGNYIQGGFMISYMLDEIQYSIGNLEYDENKKSIKQLKKNQPIWFFLNTKELKEFTRIELPPQIIANSLMVTDKYPFLKEGEFPNYTYLGIRSSRASAGTRAYIRKTVELLKKSIDQDGFIEKLKNVLIFLELEPSLVIKYKPVYAKLFYNRNLTVDEFHQYFSDQKKNFEKRTTELWGTNHYNSIKDSPDIIESIVRFLKLKTSELIPMYDKSSTLCFSYDVVNDEKLIKDFSIIEHLTKLDLISFPSISLIKRNSDFELEESSSGEYNLLASFIGLISSVKNNSLVFIDEPEVSLHPNWQMKYMDYIKELFVSYKNCHFIIATHSHFIISDSSKSNSQIIGLKKEKFLQPFHFKDYNTYGWSAEEVLYSIFNVRTDRNSYFEYDLTKLISMLNHNSKEIKEIKELYDKFSSLQLSDKDPLSIVLEKTKNYIDNSHA